MTIPTEAAALADLSAAMGELGAKAEDAEFVRALILRASATIETFCNRRFADDYILPGTAGRTLPHDIEGAAIELARRSYHARGRDPSVRSSDIDGVASFSYFDVANMPDVLALLSPYRVRTAL